MSSEKPSLHTRLCRHLANNRHMAHRCKMRACRRAGACRGSVSVEGYPPCISCLSQADRHDFDSSRSLAQDTALRLQQNEELPVVDDHDAMVILEENLWTVIRTYADDPNNRPLLRRIIRKRKLRRSLRRPSRFLQLSNWMFGRFDDHGQPLNPPASPAMGKGDEPRGDHG